MRDERICLTVRHYTTTPDWLLNKNREIMGATDPSKAEEGTIRKDFASSVEKNAVHGSDSLENAKIEIAFFFKPEEIFPRL